MKYFLLIFLNFLVSKFCFADNTNIICTFETQNITSDERSSLAAGGVYSRKTSYFVTESKSDLDRHALLLHFIASELHETITLDHVAKLKTLLKNSPKTCSYCDFKPEEVFEIIQKNQHSFFMQDISSLDSAQVLQKVKNFQDVIPHLLHENRSYHSYAIYFMRCRDEVSGEVTVQRLTPEDVYQYSRSVPPVGFNFSFYSDSDQEKLESEQKIREAFVEYKQFISYVLKNGSILPQSRPKKSLIYTKDTLTL